MTFGVIHVDTLKIANDDRGYPHIYQTREQAAQVAALLGPEFKVVPL